MARSLSAIAIIAVGSTLIGVLPFRFVPCYLGRAKLVASKRIFFGEKVFAMRLLVVLWLCIVALFSCSLAEAEQRVVAPPINRHYSPIADDVYLQEIGQKVPTEKPVTALAAWKGAIYAVRNGDLCRLHGNALQVVKNVPRNLAQLFVLGGKMWGMTADALYVFDESDSPARKVFDGKFVDMCLHNGVVHAATREDVYQWADGALANIKPKSGWLSSDTTVMKADGSQELVDPVRLDPIERIASYSGTLHLLRSAGLTLLDGATFVTDPVDWGAMPSRVHRGMRTVGSRLLIPTDRGVAVLRGAALTTLKGKDGLPYEDTTCVTAGFDGDVWIGTTKGAIRNVGNQYHYFGAHHWLPGENVHDIVVDGKTVYIATNAGIGIIRYEPYTLRKKAAFFEQQLVAGGHKRLGFVHEVYRDDPMRDGPWLREISDNDGGHTAHYLAALCFKYAVTHDPAVKREATDTLEALLWLQSITGTDGFFARAIWAVGADAGQRSTQGSGGLPAKWVATGDGLWMWKGDTSSDEVNGHFYAVSLYHDLVAQGEEKKRSARHLARIAKHIIDNGWVLRDVDGKPTRWGRWDPDYLQRPYGFESRGLNSLEAQTYMWTALCLTGDPNFRKGLDQLRAWRYESYTVREKVTFPPESVVEWDDELAFHCFHPLITYCDDPRLRSIYLRALARHWEVMRMQKIPFFNFIYGGLTGNDCEAAQAVLHLREWSLDTVSHSYQNSHRSDLATEPGYTPYMGGTRAISPRELACTWGSRSAIQYDGGNSGRTATPPVSWLEDYWMGRYYGMVAPPTTAEPALIDVPPNSVRPWGAAPYSGPPRPPLLEK
jgi:hypothetical protein